MKSSVLDWMKEAVRKQLIVPYYRAAPDSGFQMGGGGGGGGVGMAV